MLSLPFDCSLAHFWGVRDWRVSGGRHAVCASWGLCRTYLTSVNRKLGPSPCLRLVSAPIRVVPVTWYGHRG